MVGLSGIVLLLFLIIILGEKKVDLNNYKVDIKKNEQGIWVDLDENSRILVARINNKNYKSMVRKGMEQEKKKYRSAKDMPEQVYDAIVTNALAETVLLNWENLTIKGNEIVYTIPKCKEILSNPEYEEFRDMVIEIASEAERFRDEEIEEVKENVKKS